MTYRELSTILAALRHFQKEPEWVQKSYPQFDEVQPLTDEQIDRLCEELNTNQELTKIKLTGIK